MSGAASPDPYATLGVTPGVSDAELRAAYRRAVQLHHPDHNGGSAEAARRFEAVQDAYGRIRELRSSGRDSQPTGPSPQSDPGLDSRLAGMEQELAAAREARDRAARAAREASEAAAGEAAASGAAGQSAADAWRRRASDEELGYVTTEDSFGAILNDATAGLSEHLADVRSQRARSAGGDGGVTGRLADLFDELGSKLRGDPPKR